MRKQGISLSCVAVWLCACPGGGAKREYTAACTRDEDCVSGRCLPGGDGKFCSRECATDGDCTSQAQLYCCERIDAAAYCTQPSGNECRPATFGAACQGADDPFCARSGLSCVDVGGRNICTFDCTADFECEEVFGSTCGDVSGRRLCVTPDLNNLVRRETNCNGDRDCKTPGDRCLPFLDSDIDPQLYVTVCSNEQRGAKTAGQACTSGSECDHGFCFQDVCTTPCVNDSHCGPGNLCQPVVLQFENQLLGQVGASVLAFCRPQNGSFRACDSNASSCPNNEICQWELRYDAAISTACSNETPLAAGAPPVLATRAGPGEACSAEDVSGTWQGLVDDGGVQKIKLCSSGFCPRGLRYCMTPCLAQADCVGAGPEPLQCVYSAFLPHCERTDASGVVEGIGAACSGTNTSEANGVCATGFCDLDTGTCSARRDDGAACDTYAQCKSFRCNDGFCAKLCRDDTTCPTGQLCEAQVDIYDQFGTPGFFGDDSIDTPTFCRSFAECSAPPCARVTCPENPCPQGTACRPLMQRNGALRGVCGLPETGDVIGAACDSDTDCATRLCVSFSASDPGRCSSLCIDDSDCGNGTVCVAASLSGLAADRVCAAPPGSVAVGGACETSSDCASFLCLDKQCTSLCPKGIALGAACGNGTCARVAVALDARMTPLEALDDRFGFVDACMPGALPWAGNPADCAPPKRFVFRPQNGALVGACLTPIDGTLADGAGCQASTQCASGLCVDRVCRASCTAAPDSCGTLKCDLSARALLVEDNDLTAVVPACRGTCTTDGECAAGSRCEPDPGSGVRFCRTACAADKDCSPGLTCSADLGGGLQLCGL